MKNTSPSPEKGAFGIKNKIAWTILFVILAVVSIWAVMSQSKDFSVDGFVNFITNADPMWMALTVVSMLGFIVFEGLALQVILRSFGYRRSFGHGFIYSAVDVYFSAITPSAIGGQPVSALYMRKDGIPAMYTAVALVVNLAMYTVATMVLGAAALVLRPGLLTNFGWLSTLLVIVGYVIQTALFLFLVLMLVKKQILRTLAYIVFKLLAKLHLVRNFDQKIEKLDRKMEEYVSHTKQLHGKGAMLVLVFILNLLQRVSQTAVTSLVYIASGGEFAKAGDFFLTQSYVTVGANCIPIPGAMGVTDYMMLDGMTELGVEDPTSLVLLSRSMSFYACIVVSGITVILGYWLLTRKRRKEI